MQVPQVGAVEIVSETGSVVVRYDAWTYDAQNDAPVVVASDVLYVLEDQGPLALGVQITDVDALEANGSIAVNVSIGDYGILREGTVNAARG